MTKPVQMKDLNVNSLGVTICWLNQKLSVQLTSKKIKAAYTLCCHKIKITISEIS